MNNKRSEVGGGKYNECVRLMSPDRSIVYTRGRMTHTDDLRQKYTVTTNFQRSPKRYKDSNVHSGFAESDATALLGIKNSQGSLSSLDQKPAPFPVRIAATQDKIGFGECGEVIEFVNLKRKRPVDDGLALKRTKNDPQSNSTNPSAFMGHLAVTTRCHTHKPDMKVAGGDTTFVPEDYHPESLPYAFRGRISRDSDADATHVFSGQNSSRVVPKSEPKFSMVNCIAQVSGCSEAQLKPDSGTVTSSSSPGDSANEVSDMLRSRRLSTVALENEAQSHLFGKSKGDNLAWKLQSTTRHVTDSYRQSVLLSPVNKKRDISGAYVPGMDLLVDGSDIAPIELISRFSKTPLSSPEPFDDNSSRGLLLDDPSVSQLPHQIDSNVAQRPASSAHTSTVSAQSAGLELSHATKARYAQFCQQPKRAEPTERQPLPALHLHLSKDGTSPLPPGWQRAPNTKRQTNHANKDGSSGGGGDEVKSSDMYAYYYYHVRTRQTRWDPPVYPWDADPHDVLTSETGEDDPEAPYNWGCASKYSVTHEEIEAMYTRLRQRILERQCTELLHDVAGRSDAPQGAAEQGFAIELFTLVHNVLRTFRDARCKVGRIVNDEDLYYLTKKLAQAVILKEIQHLHQAQAASSGSLFSVPPPPELTANVQTRVTTYVRKYMESKGSFYRRRVQQPLGHLQPQQHSAPHLHHPHHVPYAHHTSHHHNHPDPLSRQNRLNTSVLQAGLSRTVFPNPAGPVDHVSASPKPAHNLVGFEGRQ